MLVQFNKKFSHPCYRHSFFLGSAVRIVEGFGCVVCLRLGSFFFNIFFFLYCDRGRVFLTICGTFVACVVPGSYTFFFQ